MSETMTESFKITPLGSWIFVKLLPRPKEIGGIIVATTRERFEDDVVQAEVVSVSNYVNDVTRGDIVAFHGSAGKWIGEEITNDRENVYRMIKEDELLYLIEQENA